MKRRTAWTDPKSNRPGTNGGTQDDPPIRLAHVLFVLWVVGSVAWALYAAGIAFELQWWAERPAIAAALVLCPPILGHVLANLIIRLTGNPRFR